MTGFRLTSSSPIIKIESLSLYHFFMTDAMYLARVRIEVFLFFAFSFPLQ